MRALLVPAAFVAVLAGCDSDAFTVPNPAVLVASTDRVDFGDVLVGTSAARTLRLTNAGGIGLSIVGTTIEGDPETFGVVDRPQKLPGGASGELTLKFEPTAAGARIARLRIETDATGRPALDIELVGVGIEDGARDGGVERDGSMEPDGSIKRDGSMERDGGVERDGSTERDGGLEPDSGTEPDGGVETDGGVEPDGGGALDAGVEPDGGAANPDAGTADASVDSWTPTATSNAPSGRDLHGAVWTGARMIVFGARSGAGLTNGGRYDPTTDVWSSISSVGAPSFHTWGQSGATLVWTGTEVIAWNGYVGGVPEGGRYDPATDLWRTVSTVNQPGARRLYPIVWTGTEMIVWGGCDQLATAFPDGARYDPALDRWTPIAAAGAPSARCAHVAAWTGTEMIVWGGRATGGADLADGARYDPSSNTWAPVSAVGSPSPRRVFSGVWTGRELIVFGGIPSNATGGRYDPSTDSWAPLPSTNAPSPRQHHTAVWTGAEMIIWAGHDPPTTVAENTGAKYDPALNQWTPTTQVDAPTARYLHTAVWTGAEMIIWGGADGAGGYHQTGARYRP